MRRWFVSSVVAAAAALAPLGAMAGNQEVAEEIAANLRESGQLQGYSVGVKYQDGTVWLRGQVADREQLNSALKLVFQTAGVTRVVNNLTVAGEGVPATSEALPPASPAEMSPPASSVSLQQAQGAVGPEQFDRPMAMAHSATTPQVVSSMPMATAMGMPAADEVTRVATSFKPEAVQPVSATGAGEPTLSAPRRPAAPLSAARTTAPPARRSPAYVAQVVPAAPVGVPAAPVAVQPAPAAAMPMGAAPVGAVPGAPMPQYAAPVTAGAAPIQYDQPYVPNYAWPCYAAYPNYAAVTYPKQYSPTAWPYIGPFYPYPQVPLGWRKVCLEWHDGWWNLDFDDGATKGPFSGIFRANQ